MLINGINDIKEQIKEGNASKNINDINIVKNSNNEKISSYFKPSFHCIECCLIPFIKLKEKDMKVAINCINGHNNEMPLNEYMEKYVTNNLNNIACSECGLKNELKKRFKFCSECMKIFCKNCLKKHNNNKNTINHETISLKKMDTFCCLHKNRFTYYCELCHKNICENCIYLHNNHKTISLKEIKISKSKIKELRENLNKENNMINEIIKKFKNVINSIQSKFNDVIKNKKLITEFKKIILDIYEVKDSNYQIIENINKLKFTNGKLNIEPDMNDLDILYEIFNYLKCIEHNVDIPSPLLSSNDNSKKTNSTEKSNINNDLNTNNFKNKEFIYEKKHKAIFDNYLYEKEEEKNDDIFTNEKNINNNLLYKGYDNNNNSINNNYIRFENKNDLYGDIINYKEDENKNKKYIKKRIKEIIIHKKKNPNEINQNIIGKEKENKTIFEIKKIKKEMITINQNENKKKLNKTNDNIKINENNYLKEDDDTSFNSENEIEKISDSNNGIPLMSDLINEENKNNNYGSNIPNLPSNIDKNPNFNEDLNIIKKESYNDIIKNDLKVYIKNKKKINEKKSKNRIIKSKFNEKFLKKILKKKSKDKNKEKSDESLNSLVDKSFGKLRDKSKEKRIKIKRENYENNMNQKQLNLSFDNTLKGYDELDNNNFYTYEFNKEQKLISENISIMDTSFISERHEINLKNKYKTNNNLQLVKINYYKEKDKDLLNNKGVNTDENIYKDFENVKDEKNNKYIPIKEHEIKKKDTLNLNNDDISRGVGGENINNDISNDELSIDNNNNKKQNNKKKIKKIIKKKKKIKKINIVLDEHVNDINNENNENKKIENNNIDIKDESIIKNETNLKNENIINQQTNDENKIDKEKMEKKSEIENAIQEKNSKFQEKNNSEKSLIKVEDTPESQNQKEISSPSKIKLKKKLKKAKLVKKRKNKREDLAKSVDDINKINKKINLSTNDIKEKKIQRSNSFDIINIDTGIEIETTMKINSMKFDIGISCLLEISENIFAAGNLIGDINIIEKNTYKEIQTIKEHMGTINSLFKMQDGAILSASADKMMKKIRLIRKNLSYIIEFIFDGYNNYIFKGIELNNTKIISCSWDDKLFLWEKKDNKYVNTLKFNQNKRVEDILEISINKFCSVSENELKIWDSNNMSQLHLIKLKRGIISPNSLCKINDEILISISYNAINLIDIIHFNLIKSINMDKCNLICITKLNDDSILIGEDINTDNYCIFYLKQFILDEDELQYYSFKKDKFYKTNKNNYKEIRALLQFSDGIIVQGISAQFDGKDSGDIFFYK